MLLSLVKLVIASNIVTLLEDCPVFKEVITTPRIRSIKTVLPTKGWKVNPWGSL